MSKKKGANKTDQKRIAALQSQGCNAEEISKRLYIEVGFVEAFMVKPKKQPKKKAESKEITGD